MNKNVADEMRDYFDLASNENESDENDSTAENDSNNKPKFDDLSGEVYDSIEASNIKSPILESQKEEPVIDDINEPKVEKSDIKKEIIKESVSVSNEEQKDSEDDINVDDIFAKSSSSQKEIPVDDSIDKEASIDKDSAEDEKETSHAEEADTELVPEKALETTEEQSPEKDIPFDSANETGDEELPIEVNSFKVTVEDNVRIINGNFQWLLNCPNEKFLPFYKAKAESLQDMLPGGQVPFDRYTSDLRSGTVDLTVPSNDLGDVWSAMNLVQQNRERAVAIVIHVDSQYYIWERFIDIMRGVLARRQYEKPVLKQEGVVFVHMRDMELYHAKLRAIHHLGSAVLKNLDMAWETLSRRVTISMGEREVVDRTQPNNSPQKKQIASTPSTPQKRPESDASLDDFDELGGSTPSKSNEHNAGAQEIEW
jgi:hypothetical protein